MTAYQDQLDQAYNWLSIIDQRLHAGTLTCADLLDIIKDLTDSMVKISRGPAPKDYAEHANLKELRDSALEVYRSHCGAIQVTPIKPKPGYTITHNQPEDQEE